VKRPGWPSAQADVAAVRRGESPGAEVQGRRLRLAAGRGDCHRVMALLKDGVDPNGMDGERHSSLHLAVAGGHGDVVRVLIGHGGDVRVKDLQGYEPLHVAAWAGFTGIARALIRAGASVSARSDEGTALELARRGGHRELEEVLRAAGATG
jgi:ankyrin repeat protein